MAQDLAGKVILVTGATEGIGKAASQQLAARGASLTLVARNREKGERVLAELRQHSGNPNLELMVHDLSKIADMAALAAAFSAKHDRLDVLINNAGAVFQDKQLSADGFEMTFALNHLGYFVLTRNLLELLRKSPGARVVSTSSGAHFTGRIDFNDVAKRPSGKVGFRAYGDSKLANILFTRELARRLAGSTAIANCFHPGFVRSGFATNNGAFLKWAVGFAGSLFARTPDKGAETLLWLATSPEAAQYSGEYFFDKKIGKTTSYAKDDAMAAKLWEFSENLCKEAGV